MTGRKQVLFGQIGPMRDTAGSSRERRCDRLVQLLCSTRPTARPLAGPMTSLLTRRTTGIGSPRPAAPAATRPATARKKLKFLAKHPLLIGPLKGNVGSRALAGGPSVRYVSTTNS